MNALKEIRDRLEAKVADSNRQAEQYHAGQAYRQEAVYRGRAACFCIICAS